MIYYYPSLQTKNIMVHFYKFSRKINRLSSGCIPSFRLRLIVSVPSKFIKTFKIFIID